MQKAIQSLQQEAQYNEIVDKITNIYYWKKRCEAAEAVIESMECGITTLPSNDAKLAHELAYNNWITQKQ